MAINRKDMTVTGSRRERIRAAFEELGAFACDATMTAALRDHLLFLLTDFIGVVIAGAATSEQRALVAAWDPPLGPAHLFGSQRTATTSDAAAWLNGVAACSLELDDGNKYARGHPLVHVAPVVLAEAAVRSVSGGELLSALLVGYEVGARIGAATVLHPGVHPHGTWGAVGAAAGLTRLRGYDAATTSAALDAAAGMATATTFQAALDGNAVRNTWAGTANVAGLHAVRLAAAGLARNDGTAADTLGGVLGTVDPTALTDELGKDWLMTRGYVKRHAACAYTHAPADAVLLLRERAGDAFDVDCIDAVVVDTYSLAAPLSGVRPATRLAALFSIPWVIATALRFGDVRPCRSDEHHRSDPVTLALAERVQVRESAELNAGLPERRGAVVTAILRDGTTLSASVQNPVGDADHRPFDLSDVHDKMVQLIGEEQAGTVVAVVARLPAADTVRTQLDRLP